jgi:hypothetical protein
MEVEFSLVDELTGHALDTNDGRSGQCKEFWGHNGLCHPLLRSIPKYDVSNSGPDDKVG